MERMSKLYYAIIGGILTLILTGCFDSSPSQSDLKRLVSATYERCPLLSVAEFTKINGFPQKDGSYLADVEYTLLLTPSKKNRDYVAQFIKEKSDIESDGAADMSKDTEVANQIKAIDKQCKETYRENVDNISIKLLGGDGEHIPNGLSSSPDVNDQYENSEKIDRIIGHAQYQLNSARENIASVQNDKFWPPEGLKETKEQTIAKLNASVSQQSDILRSATEAKEQLSTATRQFSTCEGNVQRVFNDNKDIDERVHARMTKLENITADYNKKVTDEFNNSCHMIVLGGVLGGVFGASDDITNYAKSFKTEERARIRLIQSDNGWVLQ